MASGVRSTSGFSFDLAEVTQKSADKDRNIFLSLAQRRHGDAHHVEAKEKVVAKLSLAHELFEVLVCGRNQAYIGAQRLIAANSLEGALFAHYAQ